MEEKVERYTTGNNISEIGKKHKSCEQVFE